MVDDLLAKNLVQEILSPRVVPALSVQKKDGSMLIWVDSRAINKITIKYRFLIPILDDMLDKLQGDMMFSRLDLCNGYRQEMNGRMHSRLRKVCKNG